jgi:hypothetical protein
MRILPGLAASAAALTLLASFPASAGGALSCPSLYGAWRAKYVIDAEGRLDTKVSASTDHFATLAVNADSAVVTTFGKASTTVRRAPEPRNPDTTFETVDDSIVAMLISRPGEGQPQDKCYLHVVATAHDYYFEKAD